MRNKSIDLNNYLFAQIERLSEEELEGEKLKNELARSKAMGNVAKNIIDNASLALKAQELLSNNQIDKLPLMIGSDPVIGSEKT